MLPVREFAAANARRYSTHLSKRLPNRGQARNMKRSPLDIIETNDRNIGWNL